MMIWAKCMTSTRRYLSFCFFVGRVSPSPLPCEPVVGSGVSGLLLPPLCSWVFSGTFGFFLTTTPLRDFLVSFFTIGGLGFGGSSFGLEAFEPEIGIGGGGGPVRAATALETRGCQSSVSLAQLKRAHSLKPASSTPSSSFRLRSSSS